MISDKDSGIDLTLCSAKFSFLLSDTQGQIFIIIVRTIWCRAMWSPRSYEDPRASYDWISVMEHILVIDDERSMLEFLELLLRKEGYQVTLLEDGRKVDPDVPFIFITAFASAPTAIEALKLGAFDYITKPFQVNDFKNLVRAALQARRWKKKSRDTPASGSTEVPVGWYFSTYA